MKKKVLNAGSVEKFIQQKLYKFNAARELAWAWNSGENIILFGPGGYGKSDAAEMFNEYLYGEGLVQNESPYVMAFGQGMTEERLLGGLDIKKFKDQGEICYHLQNAFVSHEVVIFEELWDAFPAVLLILKDILQSRCVRMGNQTMPIKTRLVIACTNRSRDEVVSDASTEALMQRFLFEKEVAWGSWEKSDYVGAFACATGQASDHLAELVAEACAEASRGEQKISPRTAGKALKSARANGLESLRGMFGFDQAIEPIMTVEESKRLDREQLIWCQDQLSQAQNLAKIDVRKLGERAKLVKALWSIYQSLSVAVRDANVSAFEALRQEIENLTEAKRQETLRGITGEPREGSFPFLLMKADSIEVFVSYVKE